jgi:hypothetical protein
MDERADPSTPAANKVFLYAKDKSGISTLYAINDAGTIYELAETEPTFVATIVGTLVLGTNLTPLLVATRALTIIKAYANVKTAPVGTTSTPIAGKALVIDINKNTSTIWSTQGNRLAIADGATSGTQTTFNTTALADGDSLTYDIDYVGSTTSGADLTISVRCK